MSLVSVEDDALGEELQVIWELEPAARAFDKMELPVPKGFGPPARLDAFLDAVRRGAASIADTKLRERPRTSRVGFQHAVSGADIEAVLVRARIRAALERRDQVSVADIHAAVEDFDRAVVLFGDPDELRHPVINTGGACIARVEFHGKTCPDIHKDVLQLKSWVERC